MLSIMEPFANLQSEKEERIRIAAGPFSGQYLLVSVFDTPPGAIIYRYQKKIMMII